MGLFLVDSRSIGNTSQRFFMRAKPSILGSDCVCFSDQPFLMYFRGLASGYLRIFGAPGLMRRTQAEK
jgi:hypothetical protein